MSKLLAVVGAVLLSGCMTWAKPGATQTQMEQDLADCEYQALLSAGSPGSGTFAAALAHAQVKTDIKYACMQRLGYTMVNKS